MQEMICTAEHEYGGRTLHVGDRFHVEHERIHIDVPLLTASGAAKLAEPETSGTLHVPSKRREKGAR